MLQGTFFLQIRFLIGHVRWNLQWFMAINQLLLQEILSKLTVICGHTDQPFAFGKFITISITINTAGVVDAVGIVGGAAGVVAVAVTTTIATTHECHQH